MKIGLAKNQHERLIMISLDLSTSKLKTNLSFNDKICAKNYSFYNRNRFSGESGEIKKWKKGSNAKGKTGDRPDDYKKSYSYWKVVKAVKLLEEEKKNILTQEEIGVRKWQQSQLVWPQGFWTEGNNA